MASLFKRKHWENPDSNSKLSTRQFLFFACVFTFFLFGFLLTPEDEGFFCSWDYFQSQSSLFDKGIVIFTWLSSGSLLLFLGGSLLFILSKKRSTY